MRFQYFIDVTAQGVEGARLMAFLVYQGHDAVFYTSHWTERGDLTIKLEVEAFNQL